MMNLNGIWNFSFREKQQLEQIDPDTVLWNDVMSVPGCFDTQPAYFCKRGTGVYQRTFYLDSACKNAFLRIDGMGLRCKILLDGREIGSSQLAYSGIEFATGPLSAGSHTVFAAVDNVFDPEKVKLFYPYYDFYAFGGFYHGVSLRIMQNDFMIDRVFVRTLDYKNGKVSLEFRFYGAPPDEMIPEIRFNTEKDFHPVNLKNNVIELFVPDFQAWSPESPYLHTVEIRLNGERHTETFGIREIHAEKRRIFLNGKDLYLKGVNRHESHADCGAATSEQIMLKDLQHLRDLGCNFIRGAHYPQSQAFLDLCDRLGFLVWEESLGWGNTKEQAADPEFIQLNVEQTARMVHNSFNHPSVVIFGFLNENHSSEPEVKELDRLLCETIRKENSGRLVTFACNRVANDTANEFTDIIAYNTYPGWISVESTKELHQEMEDDRNAILHYFRSHFDPEKPVIISEMGTCGIYGQHDEAAAQWTEEFQANYVENVIRTAFACEEIRGLTIWHMNDAKSYLLKGGPIRCKPLALNLAGLYDSFRRPKLAAAVVKKYFSEEVISKVLKKRGRKEIV